MAEKSSEETLAHASTATHTFDRDLKDTFEDRARFGIAAAELARRALWNGDQGTSPVAVVTCRDARDVQQAVLIAARNLLPVSVFGGGHDWAARSASSGSLMLDLRSMTTVSHDKDTETVCVSGGSLTSHVVRALPRDRAAATGTVSTVGMTGLTLGGGYGRLTSKFGLASDNLRSAKVVLADGSLVDASEQQNSELFWALRGGGGNFGVVVSMELATHHISPVLSGMITFSLDDALDALLRVQDILDQAPDEFSILFGLFSLPSGEAVLFVQPFAITSSAEARTVFDRLSRLDGATVLATKKCQLGDTFDPEAENMWPHGAGYKISARNIRRWTAETIEPLLVAARNFPTAGCAVVIHDFRGYASRIPVAATAFPLRQEHFNVELIASWNVGASDVKQRALGWLEQLCSSMENVAMPSGYANLLGPDESPRAKRFYAPSLQRLGQIKRQVDPLDLFRSNVGHVTS